jgi:hypothetical protein
VKQRAEFTVAKQEDIEVLRQSLDTGAEWTKDSWRAVMGWNERRFRATVAALREIGYPVISTSEQGSTYRKAWSEQELEDFIRRELLSRIRHLDYQVAALRNGAARYFGGPEQVRLIS